MLPTFSDSFAHEQNPVIQSCNFILLLQDNLLLVRIFPLEVGVSKLDVLNLLHHRMVHVNMDKSKIWINLWLGGSRRYPLGILTLRFCTLYDFKLSFRHVHLNRHSFYCFTAFHLRHMVL